MIFFWQDHLVLLLGLCDLTGRVLSIEQENDGEGHDVHVGLDDDPVVSCAASEDTDDGKVIHIGAVHGLDGLEGEPKEESGNDLDGVGLGLLLRNEVVVKAKLGRVGHLSSEGQGGVGLGRGHMDLVVVSPLHVHGNLEFIF